MPVAIPIFYFETGNGTFDGNISRCRTVTGLNAQGFPQNANYGDSFVKIGSDATTQANENVNGWGLKVLDYFSPQNNQSLNGADRDLGSGGPDRAARRTRQRRASPFADWIRQRGKDLPDRSR